MITVKTPFGIGFATDQADYERMMMFVEGAKAALEFSGMMAQEPEPEDTETTETEELRDKMEDWARNKDEYPSLREIWRKLDREIREHYPDVADEDAEDIVNYIDSLRDAE